MKTLQPTGSSRRGCNDSAAPVFFSGNDFSANINGDTTPYHILYDRQARRISGIIDFGTAGIGDPAADFATLIYSYGETFLRRMAKFYPEIRYGIDRARFWAGTLELQWALSGIRARNTGGMVDCASGRRERCDADWQRME